MNSSDIQLLYQYNDWANKRILAAAEGVSEEQFLAHNDFGWGSLRGALLHILSAEVGWRTFLAKQERAGSLEAENFPDVAALRTRWQIENRALWDYLNSLRDDDLTAEVSRKRGGKKYRWVVWNCLAHVVNHGTQHRSECAALLTGFGQSPGDLDLMVFLGSQNN